MSDAFIIHAPDDPEIAAPAVVVLEQHGRRTRRLPSAAATETDPVFMSSKRRLVVMIPSASGEAAEDELLGFVEGKGRGVPTLYVADSIAPGAYKRLVRAGGEWLTREAVRRELPELLQKMQDAPAEAGEGAVIVAFLPTRGGAGNTTLVAECGVAAARAAGKGGGRVAAIDLNVQSGALAHRLDLEPRLDFAEILNRPDRLDARLAEAFVARHGSGLDVYAGASARIPFDEVGGRALFALVDRLAHLYDRVLVDLPALRFSWTEAILAGADGVVVTGAPDVPGLRRLTEDAGLLDALGVEPRRAFYAVNGCGSSMFGRIEHAAEIMRALAGRDVLLIRRDEEAVADAADLGRPVLELHPRAAVAKDIRALAERIAAVTRRTTPAAQALAAE